MWISSRNSCLSGVIKWRVKVSLGVSSSRDQRAGQPEFYESNTKDSCQKSVTKEYGFRVAERWDLGVLLPAISTPPPVKMPKN